MALRQKDEQKAWEEWLAKYGEETYAMRDLRAVFNVGFAAGQASANRRTRQNCAEVEQLEATLAEVDELMAGLGLDPLKHPGRQHLDRNVARMAITRHEERIKKKS